MTSLCALPGACDFAKQFLIGLNMLLPAVFYSPAWQLFLEATTSHKQPNKNANLWKQILIN